VSLEGAPAAFAEKRQALIGEIANAESSRRAAADQLATAENALAEADRDARAALEAMSGAREEAARAEERFEGAKRRLTDIAHEIREMLEVEPGAVAELAELKPDAPLPEVEEIEKTLDRIRRERERLGAVNLRAEESLPKSRLSMANLTRERDDLVEAIKRLRQGIQKSQPGSARALAGLLRSVKTHFERLFTRLFGGGTASCKLIESDDPLEAGLEIVARPRARNRQRCRSSPVGEQALTALALIFAVFLTNPAPICVLDEVDARLMITTSSASATCWTR